MPDSDKTLVCRLCNVLPERLRDESGREPDLIRCPSCGAQGKLNEVRLLAAKYVSHGIIDDFPNNLTRSFSGSKHVRYVKGKRSHLPAPPFVFR